ncbi:MAG: hypothetical protein KGN36_16195 [Acidobacteriota bacterium]|nr:hypothetical protein [Acidobacteriota bacterium]
MMDLNELPRLDAKTFQEPLGKLAEVMAQKVLRECVQRLRPAFIAEDLFIMIRQAMATYEVLFYLNADERREGDCNWRRRYGVVTAPLVRTMIDCLYNVTAILENPSERGVAYRKSGLKKRLAAIEEDMQTYRGMPAWHSYLDRHMWALRGLIDKSGLTVDDVRQAKAWPTLGNYLRAKPEEMSPNQRFLKTFTHAQWREYSAMSHAGCEGFIGELPAAVFFMEDVLPHEQRPGLETAYTIFLTRHIGRAALILLCIVTELQLFFRFDGARIDERIAAMWRALLPLFEGKELYDEHYAAALKEKGITQAE